MNTRPLGALLAAALTAGVAADDTVTFELIDGAATAMDLTPDGRYVVGSANAGLGPYIYDRVTDTFTLLPGSATWATAVSDDGTVVLGGMPDPETGAPVAAIWREGDTEWTSLGYLPDALQCPSLSSPYELSADGSVAVGLSWDGCSGRAFRWTEETGMVQLEVLANGGNRASVVSADGSIIAGFAQSTHRTPAAWDSTLSGELLDPKNGVVAGEVYGISDDGATLLVEWDGDSMKIVDGGEPELIGFGTVYPGWSGNPKDIADDGTIIGYDNIQLLFIAWIQPQGLGQQQDLAVWIENNGGQLPDDAWLDSCEAISSNGRVIIGNTTFYGAWIVTVGGDCPADTNGDFTVDVQDLVNVILAWGTGDANADVNADGTVDVQDLVEVIVAWGDC